MEGNGYYYQNIEFRNTDDILGNSLIVLDANTSSDRDIVAGVLRYPCTFVMSTFADPFQW